MIHNHSLKSYMGICTKSDFLQFHFSLLLKIYIATPLMSNHVTCHFILTIPRTFGKYESFNLFISKIPQLQVYPRREANCQWGCDEDANLTPWHTLGLTRLRKKLAQRLPTGESRPPHIFPVVPGTRPCAPCVAPTCGWRTSWIWSHCRGNILQECTPVLTSDQKLWNIAPCSWLEVTDMWWDCLVLWVTTGRSVLSAPAQFPGTRHHFRGRRTLQLRSSTSRGRACRPELCRKSGVRCKFRENDNY